MKHVHKMPSGGVSISEVGVTKLRQMGNRFGEQIFA